MAGIQIGENSRLDVLIVDDNEEVRRQIKTLLDQLSYKTVAASNGAEALRIVSQSNPRLVVSDLQMPRINGCDLLHAVRQSSPSVASTPFIMLAGPDDEKLARIAENLGISGIYAKPLDQKSFADKVIQMLGRPKQAAAAPKQAAKPGDAGQVKAAAAGQRTIERSKPPAGAPSNPPPRKQTPSSHAHPKQAVPIQAKSPQDLHDILMETPAVPKSFGHVFCLGTEEIKERVGEKHWDKLRETVTRLMTEAAAAVCRPEDVYLTSEDGSVIIVFGSDDVNHAEAAVAKAAKHVSDALFGKDGLDTIKVTSMVRTAEGYVTDGQQNVSDVLESLINSARKHMVRAEAGEEERGRAAKPAAPSRAQQDTKTNIPNFRDELMSRLSATSDAPIEFRYVPVWDIQRRIVNTFICLPARQTAIKDRPIWGYGVLGNAPTLSEIVDLDIACLEYGLLEIINFLSSGTPVNLNISVNFETLASKQGRQKLLTLLREVPANIRKLVGPILTHAPDGIPEMRIAEITGELRSLTNMISVEVFPSSEGKDILKTVSRMRAGGIECIMSRVRNDRETSEIQIAKRIGERVRQLGGKSGVTGIRHVEALNDLAYSSLDLCTGRAIGGPYERLPAPFAFDAKSLEKLGGSR